jgi:heme exporter protein B
VRSQGAIEGGTSGVSFAALLRRDLLLVLRQGSDALTTLAFYLLAVMIFPFGVGPEPALLARIGAGLLWTMALFAALLSLDRLFQQEQEDGGLEQLALAPLALEWSFLAKALAHWLATGLPLLVAAPLLAFLLRLEAPAIAVLVLALALGGPALTLVGAVGAALTLGARRGAALLPLIILPLYVPVLIFGVAAVDAAASGLAARPHLLLLGAYLLAALPLAPWAGAAALRLALE